jgi:hypothetical protein
VAGAFCLGGGSLAIAGMGDGAGQVPQTKRFHAELNSYQEVPSASTRGFGEFDAWLENPTTLRFVLSYADLEDEAFMSHIHFAQRSVNGGISVWLCGELAQPPVPCPPHAGTVTGEITPNEVVGPSDRGIEPMAFDELLRAMRAGHTYVNVHSSPRFGGGEIRGQVNDRDQKEFTG